MRNRLVFSTLLGTVLFASAASAQSKTAIAEDLYNKGKEALDLGRVSEACKKFGESQRVDPATGTLFALATCHEKEGKSASAWGEFLEVAELYKKAGKTERETAAREAASRLEKTLIRLTLTMPDRPKAVEIKLDGNSLSDGILGSALPVDPGEHTLIVSAPGKKPWEHAFKIDKATANTKLDIPALADLPPEEKQGPQVIVQNVGSEDDPGAVRRTVGWLTLGGGVVLGGVAAALQFGVASPKAQSAIDEKNGTVTGVTFAGAIGNAIAANPSGLDSCDDEFASASDAQRDEQAAVPVRKTCDKYQSAKSLQTLNIVMGVVGGVAVVTGIVLVVTSFGGKSQPKEKKAGLQLTPLFGPTSVGLAGTF